MPRVIGIDPGTGSWDLLGLEDRNVFLDVSIPTKKIMNDPRLVIDIIKKNAPLDAVMAPSGHGIPLKPIAQITKEDIIHATLRRDKDPTTMGLGKILSMLRDEEIPGFTVPGVKQLKTVKRYYKYNKIDMGTADKVCSVAAAIEDQSKVLDLPVEKTGFILIEVGMGFNATIAVENGRIIDGIGGLAAGWDLGPLVQ